MTENITRMTISEDEDTDGQEIYPSKAWLERFNFCTKGVDRVHNGPLKKEDRMTRDTLTKHEKNKDTVKI